MLKVEVRSSTRRREDGTHFTRAQRAPTALLLDAEPDLAAGYQKRLAEAGYTSVPEERALAEALLHRFLDGADLDDPAVLDVALNATVRIAGLKMREERAGRQAGMTSADELLRFRKHSGGR